MKLLQNRKAAVSIAIALLMPTILLAEKETLGVIKVKVGKALEDKVVKNGKTQELNQIVGSLNSALVLSFHKTGKFTIVSRDNLQAVMEEMALSGNAKLTGAKYILDTTITGFEDNSAANNAEAGTTLTREIILSGIAEIKKLNGELFEAAPFAVTNRIGKVELPGVARGGKFGEGLLESAPKDAANQIASFVMTSVSSPPEVVAVNGKEVTIDWVTGMPIAKNDVWEACVVTGSRTNKEGRVISIKKYVGKVIIRRVDADGSTGEISGEDGGIIAGCVLRKPQ